MKRQLAMTSVGTVTFMAIVILVHYEMVERKVPDWVVVVTVAGLCIAGLAVAKVVGDHWER